MPISITVPQEYGYVLLAASAAGFVGFWHSIRSSGFRKAAKIPYPIPYAIPNTDDYRASSTDAKAKERYLFNCAQRAHANYLENLPLFLPALMIAGLKYPVASSVMGGIWNVSRVIYAVGYTRADKDNGSGRLIGGIPSTLVLVGLLFTSAKVAVDYIL